MFCAITQLWYEYIKGSTNGTTIAGLTLGGGGGRSELRFPTALFLTSDQTMFIIDANNFRVQKWNYGEPLGFTVVGGKGSGSTLDKISTSYGLFVDDQYNIYVSECANHRVTFWMNNNTNAGSLVRILLFIIRMSYSFFILFRSLVATVTGRPIIN